MSEEFVVTPENYYSPECNEHYMSFHTYLQYAGHMGVRSCEAKAEAIRKGEWKEENKSTALQVGSFVDSFFEGTLEKFKEENPDMFTKTGANKGELKAPFKQAEKMIERCLKDEYFMATMSGEKQKIFTANMFGTDVKIKIDSYIPDVAIVDLKTTSDLHKMWKVQDYGYVSVPEYWFYTGQLAWYQKVVEINTGKKLPCYLSFVTKDDSPEICVVNIDQQTLDHALNEIEMNMPNVLMVRSGEVEPIRCEKCDYCRATRKLEGAISMYDLIEE